MSMDYEFPFTFEDGQECGKAWLPMSCDLDCAVSVIGDDDGYDVDGFMVLSRNKWETVPASHPLHGDLKAYVETPAMKADLERAWSDHRYNLKVEANVHRIRGAA